MAKKTNSKALLAEIEKLKGQREQLIGQINWIAGRISTLEEIASGKLDLGLIEKEPAPPAIPPGAEEQE